MKKNDVEKKLTLFDEPKFRTFYDLLEEESGREDVESVRDVKLLTMSVIDMSLLEFLKYISDNAGISLVCDVALDNQLVSMTVVDTEVSDVLSAVARRYGVDITRQGNVYYIGSLQPHDRAILVRKIKRLSPEEIVQMVNTLASEVGKVACSSDGLTVVGDRVRVLQNITSMFDQIETARTNTWVLQMYVISGTRGSGQEFGFTTSATLDIAAIVANARSKVDTLGAFSAMLKAVRSSSRYEILAEPMMLLTDGGKSGIQDGETIPIPRRSVSDSGSVNTTGFDFIKTGFVIDVALREMSSLSAMCNLDIELSQVTSFVENAPVTSGQKFSTAAVLESGGTYLLGSFSRHSATREKSGSFVDTLSNRRDNEGNIEIWLRCYRIRGSYDGTNVPP